MHAIADLGRAFFVEAREDLPGNALRGRRESPRGRDPYPQKLPACRAARAARGPIQCVPIRLWPCALRPASQRAIVKADSAFEKKFLSWPSSTRATRISPAPALIRISFFIDLVRRIASRSRYHGIATPHAFKKADGFEKRQPDHIRIGTIDLSHESFGPALDRVAAGFADALAACR